MPETTIGIVSPERRRPETVVTSENLAEYQNKKLDISDINVKAEEKKEIKDFIEEEKETVEAKEQVEEKTEEDEDKELRKVKRKTLSINDKFHDLTAQKKEAIARAEAAEKKATELENKLSAKIKAEEKPAEDKPRPNRTDYFKDGIQNDEKYIEDLTEWKTNKTLQERDESDRKARLEADKERINSVWRERVEIIRQEIPDYTEKLANSTVVISDPIRDAILESDIGPKILYHFANNPDVANKIGKMTVGKALIALGKLEATLEKPVALSKEAEDVEPEISKAPPPISPLKGSGSISDLPADLTSTKNFYIGNNHAAYVQARKSGKIK